MTRHYCTYFDHRYLSRGLTLYASLRQHDPCAVLWVLALDERCAELLQRLSLPQLQIVRLGELESRDTALPGARANRSLVEYYFTLSPCWPRHLLLENPEIAAITYVDADMAFFSDPEPLFHEIGTSSVAITPHRFAPRCSHLEIYGHYNVGWLTFRRDADGMACLDWWRDRCLEWCRDELDGDRFADQKYLDSFPRLFGSVHSIRHAGVNLAPWNIDPGSFHRVDSRLFADASTPLVIYHFQGVKRLSPHRYDCNLASHRVRMSACMRDDLYAPYARSLEHWHVQLEGTVADSARRPSRAGPKDWPERAVRRLKNIAYGSIVNVG